MRRALIGHTGFVGGNLSAQADFDDLFNSSNIEQIAEQEYALVVCAGAPAEKWKANQDPAGDAAALERLKRPLGEVRARRMVLISTVDVYPTPIDVDESTPIDPDLGMPYGKHRHALERFVGSRFDSLIVRLPALFGPGLKKNAVYDLLHDHRVEHIHPDSEFQFYDLQRLWSDLELFLAANLQIVNIATEPIRMGEVAEAVFGRRLDGRGAGAPARYDVRSRHGERFGGEDGYLLGRPAVLAALEAFVESERKRRE